MAPHVSDALARINRSSFRLNLVIVAWIALQLGALLAQLSLS